VLKPGAFQALWVNWIRNVYTAPTRESHALPASKSPTGAGAGDGSEAKP
jgi:hypothetical protein